MRGGPLQHETRAFSLEELMRLVASGGAALPEFQREFVWDPNQVVELLDSVANGWPIGSLLILEGPQPFGIKGIEGGPSVEPKQVRYYLLDGQQRVTSLYHALTDTGDYVYYVDLDEEADEDDAPPIRWANRSRGIPQSRRETSLTIAQLADERFFENFIRSLPSARSARVRNLHKIRVGYLSGGEYGIPATLMRRDIELEALTRIFETLNRTGVRLDAFDLMVAVLYPEGFHLREAWDAAVDQYPRFTRYASKGLELLKLVALWRRDHDRRNPGIRASRRVLGVRQRDVLRVPPAYVREHWSRALSAYDTALNFMEAEGGVADASGIPSEAMLLTLSYLLDDGVPPSEVARWYWAAIADQRYLQGANTQILSDIASARDQPLLYTSSVQQALAALQEPVRRNRILRMGVRGLIVRQGGLDPLTKRPLAGGSVVDVSLTDLLDGKFAMRPERPVVDILVFSLDSADHVKRQLRSGHLDSFLAPEALESQGAPPLWQVDDGGWRLGRGEKIANWMEQAL
jgi:hypothetical protein